MKRVEVRRRLASLPLRWRLALASFALLAVLLGSIGVLVSVTATNALLANQSAAIHNEAKLALSGPGGRFISFVPPDATPPPAGDPTVEVALRAPYLVSQLAGAETRAAVILPDGTLIAASQASSVAPAAVEIRSNQITQALTTAQSATSYQLINDQAGQRQLVVMLPLVQNGHTVALLVLDTPTAPLDGSIATINLILIVGIVIALLIAAALMLPLVNTALRPLIAMERTTRQIADGALSLRLDEPATNDEIGRLARAFNSMVARLELAFSRQKRFVADVSHELRTPLTALGGGLEMLMLGADQGNPETSSRLIRGMYAETERMRRLVEDLLTLTRLDEGRAHIRIQRLDAGALLRDLGEQARALAKGQTVAVEVPEGLPSVAADPDRLRQVLLNLVDNALKFTPDGGSVTLSAAPDDAGAFVMLAVRDTGVGVAAEALPHVFERFYRADQARARTDSRSGGSGLGLAIARSLVEAQGGQIDIASTEGAGTTVRVWLRVFPNETPALPAPESPTVRAASPGVF